MQHVVVTGVGGDLGGRVVRRLAERHSVASVVGLDLDSAAAARSGVDVRSADVADTDPTGLLGGADTVLHLAFTPRRPSDPSVAARNVAAARRLLDGCRKATSVRSVVLVSTAAVYGAWPDNPIPIVESAPLRPSPGFAMAHQKAEIERLAAELRADRPDIAIAVLRPVPTTSDGVAGWFAEALRSAALLAIDSPQPPRQFLHLDDLAEAVVVAAGDRLDGAFNVAPDGWIEGDMLRALVGMPAEVPVPDRFVQRVGQWSRDLGLTDVPDGLDPYLRHPFVVANDRLKATGWAPLHTNEQAFVAGHEGSPWTEMSPKRRQELALGASAAVMVGAVSGAVALLRRRRR